MCWFRFFRIGTGFLFVTALSVVACIGQQPSSIDSARFAVASIRPTGNTDGRALLQATPGRLVMTNLTLRRLILIAYDLQDDQLTGDLNWIDSAHYDIQAEADGNPSLQQMEGPMLQSLLEQRFRLAFHRQTQQLPVYRLAVAKKGSRLQVSKKDSCVPYVENLPPPIASPQEPGTNYCGVHVTVNGLNRAIDGKGITMAALAANLSRAYTAALGRVVVDGTELTGRFDIHLEWTMDAPSTAPDPGGNPVLADSQGPSIFTALQEQLGLRLEPAKGSVDVVVIDHIEKPSEN